MGDSAVRTVGKLDHPQFDDFIRFRVPPAKAPPSGPGWLHEIKHDGFRILARRDSAGVQRHNARR
jgi:ATP-dependent DNA ligase